MTSAFLHWAEVELLGREHQQRSDGESWESLVKDVWDAVQIAQDRKDLNGQQKKQLVVRCLKKLSYSEQLDAAIPHLVEAVVAAWKAAPPRKEGGKQGRRCLFF